MKSIVSRCIILSNKALLTFPHWLLILSHALQFADCFLNEIVLFRCFVDLCCKAVWWNGSGLKKTKHTSTGNNFWTSHLVYNAPPQSCGRWSTTVWPQEQTVVGKLLELTATEDKVPFNYILRHSYFEPASAQGDREDWMHEETNPCEVVVTERQQYWSTARSEV